MCWLQLLPSGQTFSASGFISLFQVKLQVFADKSASLLQTMSKLLVTKESEGRFGCNTLFVIEFTQRVFPDTG